MKASKKTSTHIWSNLFLAIPITACYGSKHEQIYPHKRYATLLLRSSPSTLGVGVGAAWLAAYSPLETIRPTLHESVFCWLKTDL